MLPLIFDSIEFNKLSEVIKNVIHTICDNAGENISYKIGTMIELPRAALKAGEIATNSDYFSFGTNDLTQTTFGISRDDVASFIPEYIRQKIITNDPFITLDQEGVGELIKIAVERGRKTKPDLKIGICGEHGGDPASIHFFHSLGFNYVSCSPYRIPIARLVAAQAVLLDTI